MKTYYRGCIPTLTVASGLLMAGGHLDSNSSEILAQHPRSDVLCLTEISATESVFARLFGVLLIVLSISDAWAWSAPGHMTVAAIAYRDLSPVERQKFDAILESHPQFQSWLNRFPDNVPNLDQGLYVAMAASLWPDQIRNHNDPSTFPNWHFVDYPLIAPSFPDRGSPTPQGDILFGIGQSEAILSSASASAQDRAEKLSWLIHLVCDIHQPLHCATLVNSIYPAPEGDRGRQRILCKGLG